MVKGVGTLLGIVVVSSMMGCANSTTDPGNEGSDDTDAGTGSDDATTQPSSSSGSGNGSGGNASGSDNSSGGGTGSSGSSSGKGSGSGSSSGSGSHADGGSSSGPITTSGSGPVIPAVSGTCPTLATGNVTIMGQQVQLSVGAKTGETKNGPVFFYWHGTGSSASEVALMGAAVNEITSQGGIVASFSTSTKMGTDTGDAVWYTGDFAMADQILACAVQQGLSIDTRRIYTGGCSAGGLQAGSMLYGRSSYLAAVMPNSGGVVFPGTLQDPKHVPALITTHGKMGTDVVVIDFSTTSATEDKDVVSKGGFAVDCDHGGGHCGAPAADIAGQWQFCKDHPFGVSPEPYKSALPSSLPTYCKIIN